MDIPVSESGGKKTHLLKKRQKGIMQHGKLRALRVAGLFT